MTTPDLDAIRARAEAARQAAASGTTGTPPNVDGLSIHDALDIFAESAEDVPALLAEVERLRRGRDIWRAERNRLAATLDRLRALHRPVEIEPSETICGHCSYRLPNGRYFGRVEEWPCPTIAAIEGADS